MKSKGRLKFSKDPIGTDGGFETRYAVSVGGVALPLFLIDDGTDGWGVSYQSSIVAKMRRYPELAHLPRLSVRARRPINRKTAVQYLGALLKLIPTTKWERIVYTLQKHPELILTEKVPA